MGFDRDQGIPLSQNKILSQSKTNGVDIHHSKKFKEKKYTFRGRVELLGEPYDERSPI